MIAVDILRKAKTAAAMHSCVAIAFVVTSQRLFWSCPTKVQKEASPLCGDFWHLAQFYFERERQGEGERERERGEGETGIKKLSVFGDTFAGRGTSIILPFLHPLFLPAWVWTLDLSWIEREHLSILLGDIFPFGRRRGNCAMVRNLNLEWPEEKST